MSLLVSHAVSIACRYSIGGDMKFLLLLLLMFYQDTDKLLQDLNNDDPVIRQDATKHLIEQEKELERFKCLVATTSDPEVKWRLAKVVQTIESNQKFRSMSTISPLITLKFSGEIKDLFAKLAETTGQKFDARAFGDNKVTLDCVDTPLFQVLDDVCKQAGYDWEVVYRDSKGDCIKTVYGDRNIWIPNLNYTTSIELTGVGMSSKTPNSVVPGFKIQATQTSFSIFHKFNETFTQSAISFRYAADPSLKFLVGPKITYTKITTNEGVELINTSTEPVYMLTQPPSTTKSISLKGKATYRFPMKVETIVLDTSLISDVKPDANGDRHMGFADRPDIVATMTTNTFIVAMTGADNYVKDRFLNIYTIKDTKGRVAASKTDPTDAAGFLSVYDDHFQFYMYSNGSTYVPSSIEFQYVTELRDISFDFAIDNIPLY